MNRRDFWTTITGGLLGTRLGWFKSPSNWWMGVDLAEESEVAMFSDIDLSKIDLKPLIESFRKLEFQTLMTSNSFAIIRKDICASPVFLDLAEEDDVN